HDLHRHPPRDAGKAADAPRPAPRRPLGRRPLRPRRAPGPAAARSARPGARARRGRSLRRRVAGPDGQPPAGGSVERPMRRADRLFRLLLRLRHGRITTAARLARELEVSERTVYRDISDLAASGMPIVGEAGVGYRLQGFDLPPLMFDREEIEAMVLGARVVEAWGDEHLAEAASEALAKIEAVLPRGRSHLIEETRLYAPLHGDRPATRLPLSAFRLAVRERRLADLRY